MADFLEALADLLGALADLLGAPVLWDLPVFASVCVVESAGYQGAS